MSQPSLSRFYVAIFEIAKAPHFRKPLKPSDLASCHMLSSSARLAGLVLRMDLLRAKRALVSNADNGAGRQIAILALRFLDVYVEQQAYIDSYDAIAPYVPYGATSAEFIAYADELALPNIRRVLQIAADNRLPTGLHP